MIDQNESSGGHDMGFPKTGEAAAVEENGDARSAEEAACGDAGEGGV